MVFHNFIIISIVADVDKSTQLLLYLFQYSYVIPFINAQVKFNFQNML